LYRDFLPWGRAAWVNKQIVQLRRNSSEARDDDVLAERLAAAAAHPDAANLLERVRAHRSKAQEPMIKTFKKLKKDGRFDRRLAQLLQRVGPRRSERRSEPKSFGPWAAQRLSPILSQFFEAGQNDLTDLEALHDFRIRGKKLRYAMELTAAAFSARLRNDAYSTFVDLQEKLGVVNDHASAQVCLRHWFENDGAPGGNAYRKDMLDDEQVQLDASRTEFMEWWTPQRERRLRELFNKVLGANVTSEAIDGGLGEPRNEATKL
jgi:CHAD domain-containing protein